MEHSENLFRLGTESAFEVLARAQALSSKGENIINLGIGQPDFKTADHIVDIGPDGGIKGGKIIAEGKPEDIVKVNSSYTGKYLAPLLISKYKKIA